MVKKELSKDAIENNFRNLLESPANQRIDIKRQRIDIKRPNLNIEDEIVNILKQRKDQRTILFFFVITLTTLMTFSIFFLVFWNARQLSKGLDEIIDPRTLQVLSAAFFIQLFMVIKSMSKALWDDKSYMNSSIIKYLTKNNRISK